METGPVKLASIFSSIQGEASYSGYPTTFVRLAGCPHDCSWCDTDYEAKEDITRHRIMERVRGHGNRHVCVTGGEPLAQDCRLLFGMLCDEGYIVSLETGGIRSIEFVDERVRIVMDIKCPASGETWNPENLAHLKPTDDVKFVVVDDGDFLWAEGVCRDHWLTERFRVWFSTLHGLENTLAGNLLKSGLNARMQVQLHKIAGVP